MPNWVKNRVAFTGKNANKVMKSLLSKDELDPRRKMFDFNKIIPMPKSLNIESGSVTDTCIELYMTSVNPMVNYFGKDKMEINRFLKIKNTLNAQRTFLPYDFQMDESKLLIVIRNLAKFFNQDNYVELALAKGKVAVDNVEAYGYKDWYDWSVANWGTKWNACDTVIKGNTIEFETAWAPVPKLLKRLSEIYCGIKIDYTFAEEQIGVCAGHLKTVKYQAKNMQIIVNKRMTQVLNFGAVASNTNMMKKLILTNTRIESNYKDFGETMRNLTDYADMLTIKDLCELLEISRYTAYKFIRNNKIKFVQVGNKFLISKSSLSKFLGA